MFYNHRTSSTSSSDQQGDEFSNSTVTDIMGFIKEKNKGENFDFAARRRKILESTTFARNFQHNL
jgi:hypothetical protein